VSATPGVLIPSSCHRHISDILSLTTTRRQENDSKSSWCDHRTLTHLGFRPLHQDSTRLLALLFGRWGDMAVVPDQREGDDAEGIWLSIRSAVHIVLFRADETGPPDAIGGP
jgi:hypothetical protein